MDHVLPNSQIPFIGDFVRIVCAVSNKYLPPINATKDTEEDQLIASWMKGERVTIFCAGAPFGKAQCGVD